MRVFRLIAVFVIAELMVSAQSESRCATRRAIFSAASETGQDVLSQAQNESAAQSSGVANTDDPPTMFNHSDSSPFWISGQANIIFQAHPSFHAAYSGDNSLTNAGEYKTSLLGTLFLGLQMPRTNKHTEFLLDIESTGGRGISQALGLAGFTNLDVVRNPNLSSKPYLARVEIHQIVPLSTETAEASRGPFNLATEVSVRRLEFRLGKMSAPDSFDVNSVGSDSHLQFTNWTIDNNGAYDYAADTRGYTYGAVIEYQDRIWAARYGLMLMPTVANGIDLDWSLRRARGENMEFELRKGVWWRKPGAIRVLSYVNHALWLERGAARIVCLYRG